MLLHAPTRLLKQPETIYSNPSQRLIYCTKSSSSCQLVVHIPNGWSIFKMTFARFVNTFLLYESSWRCFLDQPGRAFSRVYNVVSCNGTWNVCWWVHFLTVHSTDQWSPRDMRKHYLAIRSLKCQACKATYSREITRTLSTPFCENLEHKA